MEPAESLPNFTFSENECLRTLDDESSDISWESCLAEDSSAEEFIEITNTEGEKMHYKIHDPELMDHVRGTMYEQELLELRRSTSRVNITSSSSRKRLATSDQYIHVVHMSSSESTSSSDTSSEEDVDGVRVSLEVLLIENKKLVIDGIK